MVRCPAMSTSKPANGESAQRETNRRLGKIEQHLGKIDQTLETSSKLFELMHQRLESLEEGQQTLVEGQKQVIDRLDRLVEMGMRERTEQAERLARVESRLETLEARMPPAPH